MRASRARSVAVSFALAVSLLAAAMPAAAAGPSVPPPDSIAAVGDSITQAASTAGGLGVDAPQNSWATGTSAIVNSHLLRLLAGGAPIPADGVHNMSVSGAKVAGLAAQMASAGDRAPDYLTVLIGGNDVCTRTEAEMTSVDAFRAGFQAAMAELRARSPETLVYVVSIPRVMGLWELFRNNFWARLVWSAGGVCQSLLVRPTSTAAADVERRARVDQRNRDFNAVLAEVCSADPRCLFDGGAAFNTAFAASDVSGDYFHPSVAGQAKLARVSWDHGYAWQLQAPVQTMRIGDLSASRTRLSSSSWRATVTIRVTTPAGIAVQGATVSGGWTVGAPDTCTTSSAGSCTVTSDTLSRSSTPSVTFTVTGATHASYTYDPAANLETSISVTRP